MIREEIQDEKVHLSELRVPVWISDSKDWKAAGL